MFNKIEALRGLVLPKQLDFGVLYGEQLTWGSTVEVSMQTLARMSENLFQKIVCPPNLRIDQYLALEEHPHLSYSDILGRLEFHWGSLWEDNDLQRKSRALQFAQGIEKRSLSYR